MPERQVLSHLCIFFLYLETLNPKEIAGCILILIAIVFSQIKNKKEILKNETDC